MQRLLALARLCRVVAHIVRGWWTIRHSFGRMGEAEKQSRIQSWAQHMLTLLGIQLKVSGTPPASGPVLLVANHISWLDIVVIHATGHCRFVSKADVKHWPLVGTLASSAGTLYIERESRRDALRVVHHMAERLSAGDIVAVFPEGTTGDGVDVLPFHANLLQAAIAANAPAQPVGLQFVDAATGARSFAPCYVGDDTLIDSLWRTLKARGVMAVVHYGAPQLAQGRDRRAWAEDLRKDVVGLRM